MGANKVKTPEVIIKRPVIEIQQEGTIFFTAVFVDQLRYLCDKISHVEWSGLIFYSLKGTMQNLKKFIVTPYYIHLMHKGSAGATEFDDDGSMAALYTAMPELDPFEGENKYFYGKIHSHNTMGVFHSTTDHQDLQDQAGKYDPYYLSVIVNNRLEIEAKIAFTAKIPAQKIRPTKFKGTTNWELAEKEVLGIVDLEVANEENMVTVSTVLQERTAEVIKAAVKKPYNYKPPTHWQQGKDYPGRFPDVKKLGETNTKNNGSEDIEDAKMMTEQESDEHLADQLTMLDFVDTDGMDDTVNAYRFEYGQNSIVEFINGYFKSNHTMYEAFRTVDMLPKHAIHMLIDKLIPWFKKLTPWFQQNVILYIADERVKDMGDNIDTIFEAIFAQIKEDVTD